MRWGAACGTFGGRTEMHTDFRGGGELKKRDHLKTKGKIGGQYKVGFEKEKEN